MPCKIIKFLLIVMLGFCTKFSYAACSVQNPATNTLSSAPLVVPTGTPVGTVLKYLHVDSGNIIITGCSSYTFTTELSKGQNTGLKDSYGCSIYSTNVKGIGYVITQGVFSDTSGNPCTMWAYPTSHSTNASSLTTATVELIVTGPVEPGTIDSGTYGKGYADNILFQTVNFGSIVINPTTCDVYSSNVSVNFGNVLYKSFTGIGSAQNKKDFSIGVMCNQPTNLSVEIVGQKSPDATDNTILALTNLPNSATGVGVQFLYKGVVLELNNPISLQQILGNTQEQLTFTAQYFQVKDSITPGSLNAIATLNITYP